VNSHSSPAARHLSVAAQVETPPEQRVPQRGERGYQRARAKAAVLRAIQDLKGVPTPAMPPSGPVPPVIETMDAPLESSPEVLPKSWGRNMPKSIDEECAALATPSELAELIVLKRAVWPWMPLKGVEKFDPPELSSRQEEWRQDVHGDVRLLRFLRKHGAEAAREYQAMLSWRGTCSLEDELRVSPRCSQEAFTSHATLYQLMPVDIELSWAGESSRTREEVDGTMRMSLGGWDTHGLAAAVCDGGELSERDFARYWTRVNEMISLSLDGLSREEGRLVGFKVECDFSGTSWRQFSKPFLDLMKVWARLSDYYPSTSTEILFLNTPTFFNLVWTFIQPVLNDDTKSKIRVVPKNVQAA